MNKRSTYITFILIILVLTLVACEKEKISSEELEEEELVLEKRLIQIDPLQQEEVFVGIRNKDKEKSKFSFFISCETPDCQDKITSQFFPSVEVEAGEKIAVPILVYVHEDTSSGQYTLNIEVKKDEEIVGEEKFTVQVLDTVEEKKRQLIGQE